MNLYYKVMQVVALMLLLMLGASAVFSAPEREDKNPLGCLDLGYQFTLKTLDLKPQTEEGNPSLYFMFNQTSNPIQLSQMRSATDTEEMSNNHVIPPQQWAVLATDHRFVKYACSVADVKAIYGQVVDCAQSLKVCNFVRVKYGLNNRGNFWMVSGANKNSALRAVTLYGVIAR